MDDYIIQNPDIVLPDIRKIEKDTLCWDCANYAGGCSWTQPDGAVPVKGWKAKKTALGYVVKECPKFVRGCYCRGRYRTAEEYIEALERNIINKSNTIDYQRKTIGNLRKLLDAERRDLWIVEVHQSE